MLVLAHGAIKRLGETGEVDVWSPALPNCGTLAGDHDEILAEAAALFELAEPALNVYHVVKRRTTGEAITRAKGVAVRPAILQALTYPEALAAGFKTREDFYTWWRLKYASGPRMAAIPCWVATYERVDSAELYYLSHPIPGRQGDYTQNVERSIDDLESVDAERYALKAGRDRALVEAQQRWLHQRRRGKRTREWWVAFADRPAQRWDFASEDAARKDARRREKGPGGREFPMLVGRYEHGEPVVVGQHAEAA